MRRIRRISSTFDHTLGHARGAEYEFITQDHKTSIQMKLARRACLERDISRCAHFICLDMSSAHRKTRAAPGSAGKRFLNAAAPRARGRARGHTGQHNYNESRSRSCCSHTQCGRAAGKPEANRALKPTRPRRSHRAGARLSPDPARAIEEVLKGSSVEAKSPDPCTNEAFTSTALQLDRSEESRLDT